MLPNIIDLTNSPPSPPRSSNTTRILNFENSPVSFGVSENSNFRHTNQPQTTLWPISEQIYEPNQIVPGFQTNMHGERVSSVFEPLPEFRFLHETGLMEPWTQREHELFLMGLIKYGKGRWNKIAKRFLWNKTPEQIQCYASRFFGSLPYTYLHGFRRKKPTSSVANFMSGNKTHVDASTSYSVPMIVEEPQQGLMLFPAETASLFEVPPYEEARANSNNDTIMYGFQMQTNGASSSIRTNANANANGEVDLELRLG